MRHRAGEYDPGPGVSIATLAWDYPAGDRVPEHAHASHQLIYATGGVMEISAGQSSWLIPPQFAVWVPARTKHRIRMSGAVSMRTLYIRPAVAKRLPRSCVVLHVQPLLRELVLHAVALGDLRARRPLHRAMRDVIIAELESASPLPMSVTMPADPRALQVAKAFMDESSGFVSLQNLCDRIGAGVRTIERAFLRDLGISFEAWRRQVRLVKGIELLAKGCSVKEVAFQTGYRQPSAFVAMFRKTFGSTPKRWASAIRRNVTASAGAVLPSKPPGRRPRRRTS